MDDGRIFFVRKVENSELAVQPGMTARAERDQIDRDTCLRRMASSKITVTSGCMSWISSC